jgi:hypothetical protein
MTPQRMQNTRATSANEIALAATEYLLTKLTVPVSYEKVDADMADGWYFNLAVEERSESFIRLVQKVVGPLHQSPAWETCPKCQRRMQRPSAEFSSQSLMTKTGQQIVADHCTEVLDKIAAEMNAAGVPLVTVDLPLPRGVDDRDQVVVDGLALRYVSGFDIRTDSFARHFDVLWALKP